uniref:Uncharacterized protein n=1 Tax=Anguilla anguilla TaxID=7936 RepID=A0A0E9XX32_ANGAN
MLYKQNHFCLIFAVCDTRLGRKISKINIDPRIII